MKKRALISGASFAGLCAAYWLDQLGYEVTIVEVAPALKKGGTPVNILGNTIDIMKRMGLFEQIYAQRLHMERIEFKDTNDMTGHAEDHQQREQEEYEIERDVLLDLIYGLISEKATLIFNDSITALREDGDKISVTFRFSEPATFDLVFGCDGIHSMVRKLWFGEEKAFSHFLQAYFSITIVDHLLIPENTTQMYSEVGRTIMLNAYNGKTDICFAYYSEQEIPYDHRNEVQMRNLIQEQFKDAGWRSAELLEAVSHSRSFYFDKLCQVRMPAWSKGRVALVGDAGYCPSPAAGRGGSLAIDGAAALADALKACPYDHEQAFGLYDQTLRPFIERVHNEVVDFGLDVLIPRTEAAVRQRFEEGFKF